MMRKNRWLVLIVVLCWGLASTIAATIDANPSNYRSRLSTLQPGDILALAAGNYSNNLPVSGLNGTADAWIIIQGPATNPPAIFLADSANNTVEIRNSSYVAIRNLTLNGQGLAGPFGVSAGAASEPPTHHILIEGCTITNYNGGQQTVGISTKTPTWAWTIRRNRIFNAGTGLYLGNSDGSCPFVAGTIEHNLVQNPLGYCMEIKFQNVRTAVTGMPTNQNRTVIRHNVFIKNDAVSPSGDRPNLLVGGFPNSGAGSNDLYEIYGNFFCHNPRESLLQASGRVSIHDNIFVDVVGSAIRLADHDLPVKLAHVYNNTIYSAGTGISLGAVPDQEHDVFGNLIFATTSISGAGTNVHDNLTYTKANAGLYVANPSTNPGAMDFYPLAGQCQGPALDISRVSGQTEYTCDFNGTSKGGFTYRGAYAGEGANPGWAPQAAPKPLIPPPEALAIQRFAWDGSTNYALGWPNTIEWTQVQFTRSLSTGAWQSLTGPLIFCTNAVVSPPAQAASGFFRLWQARTE